MQNSDIHPPRSGLNADPVLYGVAAGLAELFPPVTARAAFSGDDRAERDADPDREAREGD